MSVAAARSTIYEVIESLKAWEMNEPPTMLEDAYHRREDDEHWYLRDPIH
jgi:hypothetical protein